MVNVNDFGSQGKHVLKTGWRLVAAARNRLREGVDGAGGLIVAVERLRSALKLANLCRRAGCLVNWQGVLEATDDLRGELADALPVAEHPGWDRLAQAVAAGPTFGGEGE